jgi:hypothetical protein
MRLNDGVKKIPLVQEQYIHDMAEIVMEKADGKRREGDAQDSHRYGTVHPELSIHSRRREAR